VLLCAAAHCALLRLCARQSLQAHPRALLQQPLLLLIDQVAQAILHLWQPRSGVDLAVKLLLLLLLLGKTSSSASS
jgi:hypothetical protein